MSDRERLRQSRRDELDAKLKSREGREEVLALWKRTTSPEGDPRDVPPPFRMVDEILEGEFPPSRAP